MGIGMPLAGMLFWLLYAVLVSQFRIQSAVYLSFFATGLVFPLGFGLTRLAGGDLFAKSPALTPLGLQLAAVQLFFWPVIIVLARIAPEWAPYVMAVLFGSHFLPYGWLYRSRGYMALTSSPRWRRPRPCSSRAGRRRRSCRWSRRAATWWRSS